MVFTKVWHKKKFLTINQEAFRKLIIKVNKIKNQEKSNQYNYQLM